MHVQAREVWEPNRAVEVYLEFLKRKGKIFRMSWDILRKALAYSNLSKRCDLCLTEKLMNVSADKSTLLNKRLEIISKCWRQNKFYLLNFVGGLSSNNNHTFDTHACI